MLFLWPVYQSDRRILHRPFWGRRKLDQGFSNLFTLKFLTYIFLWFAIIQIVISFTVYISPHLYSIIFNLFSSGELSSTKTEGALGIRPFGIGDYAFFGAGLYNCFVLLLISYILIDQSKDSHILFSIGGKSLR